MDIKKDMLEIIRKVKSSVIDGSYKMHDYLSIPEKKRKGLLKFDPHFEFDDFVAMYDTSLFGDAKEGVVFMVDGLYLDDTFTKKFLKYDDIVRAYNRKNLFNYFEINTKTAGSMTVNIILRKHTGTESLANLLYELRDYAAKNGDFPSVRESGKVKREVNLTDDEKKKCHAIIHSAAGLAAGAGAGLAQLPGTDAAVITPIQVTMVTSLGAVFDIRVTEGVAKGIVAALGATIAGRAVSQFLVGWIPVFGNAINATTAAGITEAMGWYAAAHLKRLQEKDKLKGRYDGMKAGYCKASSEYEQKLRKQAVEFLRKGKIYESEREEFFKLIDDYEQMIIELQLKLDNPDSDNELNALKDDLDKLNKLPISD